MPAILPTIASVVGIGAGIKNLTSSGSGNQSPQAAQDAGNAAAARADPFGNYRDQFAQMLIDRFGKLTDPTFSPDSIVSDPAYQFALKSGIDTVNRGAAASGMLGSGNRLVELQKMGTGLAGQFANQQQDRQWGQNMGILQLLGNFSGANINPGTAANLQFQGYQQGVNNSNTARANSADAWKNINSGLAGLKPFFQNWGNTGGNPNGDMGWGV